MATNNEKVYDEEINSLMMQIIQICKRVGMPMAATFEYDAEQFCSTCIPGDEPSDHMKDVLRLIAPSKPASALQITTEHADGSKTIEVILS